MKAHIDLNIPTDQIAIEQNIKHRTCGAFITDETGCNPGEHYPNTIFVYCMDTIFDEVMEKRIEAILTHETIHLALLKVADNRACRGLDRVESWDNLKISEYAIEYAIE